MQSPALHPVPEIYAEYDQAPAVPLKVFLSTGTGNDNFDQARKLRRILLKNGYDLKYREVPHGHNWRN